MQTQESITHDSTETIKPGVSVGVGQQSEPLPLRQEGDTFILAKEFLLNRERKSS